MAAPVVVTLDRGGLGPLDLTPLIRTGSLHWSSVVPGGFGSCSFALDGDFRRLLKQVPFLSIVRVVGDTGRVLFEGQVEDLAPTLGESTSGVTVGAFGLQNVLKETSVRTIWSKRGVDWQPRSLVQAAPDQAFDLRVGQFDTSSLSTVGVMVAGNGQTSQPGNATGAVFTAPVGVTLSYIIGERIKQSSVAANLVQRVFSATDGMTWSNHLNDSTNTTLAFNITLLGGATAVLLDAASGIAYATAVNADYAKFFDIRILGTSVLEDSGGGFYGDTLIRSLVNSYVTELGLGVVESGSDFVIDHLDASVRRSAYDILQEIAGYYAREWAVWEDALLHWRTPNLSQPQWVIPLAQLSALDLDASVQNSKKTSVVMYTDAASGVSAEATATSADRRNPYVLTGRTKDELDSQSFPMTSTTAQQLATIVLQDLGFGPVPAAGSIVVTGETIIQHAQGNAAKAWEIRAGDNITIPELPLADIFTQDGRGECLFHVVAAEADAQAGTITFTLDSYGSKRSDVLLARLAAVTNALGG